jgi:diadenosine tetraphosphate (Ap4A) HIT family hydrolase
MNRIDQLQNEYAIAFYDRFPVSDGHALVVPKRVVPSVYELPQAWQSEMWNTVRDVRATLGDWYRHGTLRCRRNGMRPARGSPQ